MPKILTDSGGQYLVSKLQEQLSEGHYVVDSGYVNKNSILWWYIKYNDGTAIAFSKNGYQGTTVALTSTSTDSYYPYSYLELPFPSDTGYDQIGNVNDIYECTFVPTKLTGYGWFIPMASTASRIRNYRYVRMTRPVFINMYGWWILRFEGRIS